RRGGASRCVAGGRGTGCRPLCRIVNGGLTLLKRALGCGGAGGLKERSGSPGEQGVAVTSAALLDEVVARVRAHPGLRGKAAIGMVADALGSSDWLAGAGGAGAVVPDGEGALVVGGEAMLPAFVEADPFGAGLSAVLANVNDLCAMGAWPLAIVDTGAGPAPLA